MAQIGDGELFTLADHTESPQLWHAIKFTYLEGLFKYRGLDNTGSKHPLVNELKIVDMLLTEYRPHIIEFRMRTIVNPGFPMWFLKVYWIHVRHDPSLPAVSCSSLSDDSVSRPLAELALNVIW